MASAPRSTINMLQGGRAVAALAVVAAHGLFFARSSGSTVPGALGSLLSYGYLGVDFFFVLSGFIIYRINAGQAGRTGWSRRYVTQRATRIYVPYWPIGIAAGIMASVPALLPAGPPWTWFATLILLPSGAFPALTVGWTLQHEIVFYGLAWLFFRTGRFAQGALLWAAAILLWRLAGLPRNILLAPINLEFLFGAAAARLVALDVRHDFAFLSLGLAASGIFMGFRQPWLSPVFGLGLACLLVPLVRADLAGRVRTPALLRLLGDASYSLYLVHLPWMALLAWLGWVSDAHWFLAFAMLFLSAVLAGLLYHAVIERPGLRLARRLIAPGSRQPGGSG